MDSPDKKAVESAAKAIMWSDGKKWKDRFMERARYRKRARAAIMEYERFKKDGPRKAGTVCDWSERDD